LKKHFREYLVLLLTAGLIILLDQLTKEWVRQNLQIGEIYRPDLWISNYARIVHWKNTGAAFGMFQNMNPVFMALSIIVCGVILYYFPQIPSHDWLVRLSMGVLLGGAIGNLIDRFREGHVTDFISVGKFPVLNIADASISVGVAILFIGMWLQERNKKEPPASAEDVAGPTQAEDQATATEEVQGE